jgi:hypothetical protein
MVGGIASVRRISVSIVRQGLFWVLPATIAILLALAPAPLWAASGGSISGTITDQSGAVVPGANLRLVNTALQTVFNATSDRQGLYSFPNLPVGIYEMTVSAPGFATQRKTNLSLDADAALRVDTALVLGQQSETVTVESTLAAQVDTTSTHLGEVVSGAQMTQLPLNGRSYTDLLAIQPGVAPVSTLLPSSVIMAGVTGTIDPSGDLNPGNLSINGQRESSNGFMVNGTDVQEHMNGGTSVIPNLDSIDEFRVLTNNFDPQYGNYNGGMINVVTRSGSDSFHGNAFEFLRNTALDARGYFDPTRSAFRQNQFGGTIGGPVKHQKVFFFGDYQGTRTTQGVSTGNITVPSNLNRTGNFSDFNATTQGNPFSTPETECPSGTPAGTSCPTINVPNTVSGPYLASLLSQQLGYPVTAGEPYYVPNCGGPANCVFPNETIPQSAWSAPGRALLQYIPSANVSSTQFSTSAFNETVRDDKGGVRIDANSRLGQLSGYYFVDSYKLDNPYPGAEAGASIPGFNALSLGLAQLFSFGDTKVFGTNAVNEFHLGVLRNSNTIGLPEGGKGVSMASQGFASGNNGGSGIYVQAPEFEGVENITFPTFVMGVPVTNVSQWNNTIYVSDGLSKVIGTHSITFGGQFHYDQVNEHPNGTFNGTFNIDGTETGQPFADFLIGTPSNYTQSAGPPFYLRNRYTGSYVQDSWRARSNLTINAGVRWDVIMPFWEKYNRLQTYVAGEQSVLYPGAPPGLVVPGDPGIPATISPTHYHNFAPRIGLAYSPSFAGGIGKAIFGASGKSSIRASYGLFYTAFPGLNTGIMYAVPPFGYNYLSPEPPLFATPFIAAATGVNQGQRFPFALPPANVSKSNPDNSVNWANFLPLAADPFMYYRNSVPYTSSYMFSIQRQLTANTLLTVSYVGNQGHHILAVVSVNPGNPALCLGLSQSSQVAPGTPTCGPFGEDSPYVSASGQAYQGTRVGQGPLYGENTADTSIANSNYNALDTTLRYSRGGSNFMLSYAYGKSIDQGSNLGEQLNPINARQSRALSAWDMRHSFVVTYTAALPFQRFIRGADRLTDGWTLSGTSRFTTGFPVTLTDNSDNSLLGTLGNGVNNYLLDTPQVSQGPLKINTNPRNGRQAFNTGIFSEETLGVLGNAKRRFFYGPGIENFDMRLAKNVRLTEAKALELRVEAFNVFNHAQFYGPASVDGQIEDPSFGHIESAQAPRLMQLAAKFAF